MLIGHMYIHIKAMHDQYVNPDAVLLGMVVLGQNSSTQRQMQKDPEFKVSLGYTASLKLAYAT